MLIREHRGTLTESLATSVEIENSLEAVQVHVFETMKAFLPSYIEKPSDLRINVLEYGQDSRTGPEWRNNWIVRVFDFGVFGFVNEAPVSALVRGGLTGNDF